MNKVTGGSFKCTCANGDSFILGGEPMSVDKMAAMLSAFCGVDGGGRCV